MKKKAFITGINGQDGSYLSSYLIDKGYKVYGMVRRNSINEHQTTRLDILNKKIDLSYGDLLDESSLESKIRKIKPNEIYNLAAQSHVKVSFEIPQFTVKTNSIGALNILEAFRKYSPRARFYQASSSEMFGVSVDKDNFQRESTSLAPNSPYGCSKVFSFYLTKFYRRAYKLFVSNGILFNHESPFRGTNFVTNKIVKTAVAIKLGLEKKLVLGNLEAERDWGYTKDFVEPMWLMLQQDKPDDFIIATGKSYTVKYFCELVFNLLDLDYKKFVKSDKRYYRPSEVNILNGDYSKAKKILGWEPKTTIKELAQMMVESDMKLIKQKIK